LINAADAIGGVYLYFPYPSHDPFSGLSILHPGCQLVTGFQALAVARSRHFYYSVRGVSKWPGNNYSDSALYSMGWVYDGTSDFGRIDRQNAFLRAMISRVKGMGFTNPLAINNFLSKLPQGIAIDNTFTLKELIGLALKYHSFNPSAMLTYTLPTIPAVIGGADVLITQEPQAEQMIVNIFGSEVIPPTNPPPNAQGATPMPPHIVPTTTTTLHTATTLKGKKKKVPTNSTLAVPSYDPRPCAP
jgi:anionic cell wall polymer biosynthesis LytR-Cps2A-Psr (LCP) family protein